MLMLVLSRAILITALPVSNEICSLNFYQEVIECSTQANIPQASAAFNEHLSDKRNFFSGFLQGIEDFKKIFATAAIPAPTLTSSSQVTPTPTPPPPPPPPEQKEYSGSLPIADHRAMSHPCKYQKVAPWLCKSGDKGHDRHKGDDDSDDDDDDD
jgi:hypothetical protein